MAKFPIAGLTKSLSGAGKADWMWDDELQMHLPVCSQLREDSGRRCGNGPLDDERIVTGSCGENHAIPFNFSPGMSPQQRFQMGKMIEEMQEHPWYPPIRLHKKVAKAERLMAHKDVIYTRWLRVRWTPRFGQDWLNVRARFGTLEIALVPIRKKDWRRRGRHKQ